MENLQYKTRGNSSPQGKPKVYFTSHPDDQNQLDAIAAEILADVNCAVFYQHAPISDTDLLLRDLSEMNLIVIPVTAKFLQEESLARDVIFPFTQTKHIPVLPIVMESGLESLFSRVLGDIQFLDPNAKDASAISYRDKLASFLSTTLVKDELAEKIRSAFDAYIFLSYRKKDRVHAKELMRLIHENEFCRDVAIWYDEYLIPGEDFNETIAESLKKSAVFALAITPNLVNEKNYVMTVEYPMAKKEGKPILAAEIVPTDQDALAACYDGIPEKTDAHDPELFAKHLINALSGIVLRENDSDPYHSYLIGLAYLSGIDVEKNPDRALLLLESAAENELPEAIEKLVDMYKNGEGVKRSYQTAITWQEKLLALRKAHFHKEKTEDAATLCLSASAALADCYEALSDYSKATSCILETLVFIDSLKDLGKDTVLEQKRAICYGMLGDYSRRIGDVSAAERYYQAMKRHSELLIDRTDEEADRIRAFSLDFLKDAKSNPEFDLPEEIWKGMEEIFLSSVDDYRIYSHRELAQCHTAIGNTALENNDREKARASFTEALTITETIVSKVFDLPDLLPDVKRELAILHAYLGDLDKADGCLNDALTHYTAAIDTLKTIGDDVEINQDIASVLHRIAGLYETVGDLTSALALKEEATAYTAEYAEKVGTVQAYESLAGSYGSLAFLYQKLTENEKALSFAQAARGIIDMLSAFRHETPPLIRSLSDAIDRLIASLS